MKQAQIIDQFNRMKPDDKVEILHRALEIKNEFRSPQECIMLAMGYRRDIESKMDWIRS